MKARPHQDPACTCRHCALYDPPHTITIDVDLLRGSDAYEDMVRALENVLADHIAAVFRGE